MPTEHEIDVDGETVAATHHRAEGDRWLFFCHGFLSDRMGSYEGRCERAVEAGYDAVRFDFRGSGDSDGAFVESTLTSRIEDLTAVVEYFDPRAHALFGSSFGGAVVFHAAASVGADAVVARAPVTYTRAFETHRTALEPDGTHRYDDKRAIDRRFFEDLDTYAFEDVIEGLEIPVAIVHGADDESVPIEDSFEAAVALETDVLLCSYAGEGHRFSPRGEDRLRDVCFDWLSRVLPGTDERRGATVRDS